MTDTPHFGVDPISVRVTLDWFAALRRGDIATLWPLTDRDYRLALTQWWITANSGAESHPAAGGGGRDAVALRISDGDHPLSVHLFRVLARDLCASIADLEDLEVLTGEAARPIGLDLEAVALFVADDVPDGVFAPGAQARASTVAVRRLGDDRLVAGINCVAVPGWPPTFL